MASCAHVPPPKSQVCDLHRPMAWFPGAYVLRAARAALSWAHVRVCQWAAAWRGALPHAGLAGECALCAFLLCKSCFIRDIIDLCHLCAHLRSNQK